MCLSYKLRVGDRDLSTARLTSTTGQTIRERAWTDIPAGEECVLHLDLTQQCLTKKVKEISNTSLGRCDPAHSPCNQYCMCKTLYSTIIRIAGLYINLTLSDPLQGDSKAYAPRFPKSKDEGWWLILGEVDVGELMALKRIGCIRGRTRSSLAFAAPTENCRKIVTLYLMSDCYLGLDQQFELSLNFVTYTETNYQ